MFLVGVSDAFINEVRSAGISTCRTLFQTAHAVTNHFLAYKPLETEHRGMLLLSSGVYFANPNNGHLQLGSRVKVVSFCFLRGTADILTLPVALGIIYSMTVLALMLINTALT